VLLFLSACRREAPPPVAAVIDARPASVPDLSAPPQPAASGPAYDPADPLTLPSIEISGEVQYPAEAALPALTYVYASRGDCLDENAPLLRRMPVSENGSFLIHILAEPKTELSLCAAAAPDPAGLVRYYGQAPLRLRIGAQREQELRDIKIPLRAGPPRRFPTPASSLR